MTFIGEYTPQVEAATFLDVLGWRAAEQPDKRAYTFLEDGEQDETHMTYGQLEKRAQAIGATLQAHGATGKQVLLLYPPGLEYVAGFLGCLYAGAVAVPAYPPDPTRLNRTLPRLQAMVHDADAVIALTTTPILAMAQMLFLHAPDLAELDWIASDQISTDAAVSWRAPAVDKDTLAFLQYTSGSTRAPRGVMLTHHNLLHNSSLIANTFGLQNDDVGVIWLPPYHDMGLIGGILQPAYSGNHCILMSPLAFLQRPMRWLEAVSRYGATVSGGPNFAYDLCVRKVKPEHLFTLDLSRWNVAFNGAEPVRAETLERFAETFAPCGFRREALYPCYGLAEATLLVSGGEQSAPVVTLDVNKEALEKNRVVVENGPGSHSQRLVGCGQTVPGQQLLIVDPETFTPCMDGVVGEIWVSGPSVAQGYWEQAEETTHTFKGYLANSNEGPFLRTGDLGFMHHGELFIGGRIKDLIIIDGLNHYPQDIEQSVENCHPAVRPGCSAAFALDVDEQERLIIVAEASISRGDEASSDHASIVNEIQRAVAANHDLRVHDVVLLKPRSIPKTSSGKIQRHACKAEYLEGTLEIWKG